MIHSRLNPLLGARVTPEADKTPAVVQQSAGREDILLESAARRAQFNFRARRAIRTDAEPAGLRPYAQSAQSLQRLQSNLRAGGPGAPRPADALQNAVLSAQEEVFSRFVQSNITLKHATAWFKEVGDALVSPRERRRRNLDDPTWTIDNAMASCGAGLDQVFATIGVGDHASPRFLLNSRAGKQADVHVVTISLAKFAALQPTMLPHLWVGPHLKQVYEGYTHAPVKLGETTFTFSMDPHTRETCFFYTNAAGIRAENRMRMEDLVLRGADVGPGLALMLVEHLRYLDPTYREHVLSTAVSTVVSQETKAAVIGAAMEHLMPSFISVEAKIPVALPLDPRYTQVTQLKNLARNDYQEIAAISKAARSNDLQAFASLLPAPQQSMRDLTPYTAFFQAINRGGWFEKKPPSPEQNAMLERLLTRVPAFGDDLPADALDIAFQYGAWPEHLDRIARHTEVDPRDSHVCITAPVNSTRVLSYAAMENDYLATLTAAGADLSTVGATIFGQAVMRSQSMNRFDRSKRGTALLTLIEAGCADKVPAQELGKVLLILSMLDETEAAQALITRLNLAVDARTQAGHGVDADDGDVGPYVEGGLTPLMLAVSHRNVKLAEFLIQRGADVNAVTEFGGHALEILATLEREHDDEARMANRGVDVFSSDGSEDSDGEVEEYALTQAAIAPEKSSVLEALRALLRNAGAKEVGEPRELPEKRFARISTVIVGTDRDGVRKVIMGRAIDATNGAAAQRYSFANDYLRADDVDVLAGARRIAAQHLSIPLADIEGWIDASLREAHAYEAEDKISDAFYRHNLTVLDIGGRLATLPLNSGDKWLTAKRATVDEAGPMMEAAHATMLRMATHPTEELSAALKEDLDILYRSNQLIATAIMTNNLAALQGLLERHPELMKSEMLESFFEAIVDGDVDENNEARRPIVEWLTSLLPPEKRDMMQTLREERQARSAQRRAGLSEAAYGPDSDSDADSEGAVSADDLTDDGIF